MAGDEEVGKTVRFRRFAKKRQAFQQAKTVGCCRGIARPSLIKHQLADIEVKPVASLLPPTTRQLLASLENHVRRRSRGQVANNRGFDVDRTHDASLFSRNDGDQQLATKALSTPQDVRARLLHRFVRRLGYTPRGTNRLASHPAAVAPPNANTISPNGPAPLSLKNESNHGSQNSEK